MFIETVKDMNKIVKMNGYVYLVENFEKKGFETYYNMGKDPDSEMWKEEIKKLKCNKGKNKKETEYSVSFYFV